MCRPCNLTGTIHHTRVTSEYEREEFRKQAAADWEQLLLLRAKELAPGREGNRRIQLVRGVHTGSKCS